MTSTNRRVLLDTSVVIKPPDGDWLSIIDSAAVSAITIAELQYGVVTVNDPLERQLRRDRIHRIVAAFDVIPFGLATTETYGLLTSLVRAAGRNPRPRRLDLLIAATAVRHQLGLLTRNPDDFRHLERVLDVVAVT